MIIAQLQAFEAHESKHIATFGWDALADHGNILQRCAVQCRDAGCTTVRAGHQATLFAAGVTLQKQLSMPHPGVFLLPCTHGMLYICIS